MQTTACDHIVQQPIIDLIIIHKMEQFFYTKKNLGTKKRENNEEAH